MTMVEGVKQQLTGNKMEEKEEEMKEHRTININVKEKISIISCSFLINSISFEDKIYINK